MPKPNEKNFELHFCHQLELKGNFKGFLDSQITIDKSLSLHFELFEDFLFRTQPVTLTKLKEELGVSWRQVIKKTISDELKSKPLFQIIKEGILVNNIALDLVYFKQPTNDNPELQNHYRQNIFSYVRQYHFASNQNSRGVADERQSIDIVLFLNGFAIVTIELKNEQSSGTIEEAISQYLRRDLSLPIFQLPFLHIVCDNERVKMAASFNKPPVKEDFRHFNKELINIPANKKEYPVHYLYHEILLPDSLLNFIETYLYSKANRWIFPRYHQQRCVRKVYDDIRTNFNKSKQLNLRYLIHHSAGSGKSNTIVWLVQNLRNLHVENNKVFDSILVLTHRTNLDDQISKDFRDAISQTGVVKYCEKTQHLKAALTKNIAVIVTIIHKFNYLKDLIDQSKKKVCIIIDEAHTSQEGKLHTKMVERFDGSKIEVTEPVDEQEEFIQEISRKNFPNIAFIALTATPSDSTNEHFGSKKGKEWMAFDTYSMDQAIKEGYIMDVAKNIINYETLYKLNYHYDSSKEYPPLQIFKALKQKAFEDDEVIKEKCKIIISVFKDHTAAKIYGRAKAMIVTSSRLCAVKYKYYLDAEFERRNLPWKSLVAFTSTVKFDGKENTEVSLNKKNNPKNQKIEDVFKTNNKIRFLIVANKFQVGFSESLLHTMFIDKSLSGRNAVQTISRLNRIHIGKSDTLAVDFTDSYDEIIRAFKKYQSNVTSVKDTDPRDLIKLKAELLSRGVFTLSDVSECIFLLKSPIISDGAVLCGKLKSIKDIYQTKLDKVKKREFRTLLSKYINLFDYISGLFNIPQEDLHDYRKFAALLFNILERVLNNEELQKEIEHASVQNFSINKISEKLNVSLKSDERQDGSLNNGSVTSVRPLATVSEIIQHINMRFKEKVSKEGVEVVDSYIRIVANDDRLRQTIINNLKQDEKQLYELVVKKMMDDYYSDFILNNHPKLYSQLTLPAIQDFINYTTYRMIKSDIA
jgi:type I restriction enzyme R subunit